MNGIRTYLREHEDEGMSYCTPYWSHDARIFFVLLEGKIVSAIIDGREYIKTSDITPELINQIAKIVNPDYDSYSGWDDLHIIMDGNIGEDGCCHCCWFNECQLLDDIDKEEQSSESSL